LGAVDDDERGARFAQGAKGPRGLGVDARARVGHETLHQQQLAGEAEAVFDSTASMNHTPPRPPKRGSSSGRAHANRVCDASGPRA